MTHRLLFVCSGNITRSPLAAALADHAALQAALDVDIQSAGTLGINGQPAYPQMVSAARELGLDLSTHRSQGLTEDLCAWATTIAVMELHHAEAVATLHPESYAKVVQLGPLAGVYEIDDPTGNWFAAPYKHTRDLLQQAVQRLVYGLGSTST
ncbi:MAG: hypothetical protein KTR31_21450 [Myxococcales bacterium]|nr:hypothetical protein [Myxococcales bacterium]